jgi:hypothetical protein
MEVKGALDSSWQECEPAKGPSRWERRVHAPRVESSLHQSAREQMEAMRAAARTRWTVELSFKGCPRWHNSTSCHSSFFRLGVGARVKGATKVPTKLQSVLGQRNACRESGAESGGRGSRITR